MHLGDWDAPFTLEMYQGFKCPIKGVLGNGDPDIEKFEYQLQNRFTNLDLELHEIFFDSKLDGKRIGMFHGNDEDLTKIIVESQLFDVFCCGHTHKPLIGKEGKTLVINPGSLVGVYLPNKQAPVTVAIYDTQENKAEIIDLDKN